MEQQKTYTLYDKVFKSVISLSQTSTINFINGLFGKNLPLNSKVTRLATENVKRDYDKLLSDCIISIGEEEFLIESQINNDNTMAYRIFDYSYYHASKTNKFIKNKNEIILKFPYPKIILLEHTGKVPDYKLKLILPQQGTFEFGVPVLSLIDLSLEELNNNKLVILTPLYLLKLRKEIEKHPTEENGLKLMNLIKYGLIDLYTEINVKKPLDEEFKLVFNDIITQKDAELVEKDAKLSEIIELTTKKDALIAEKDAELEKSKKAELKAKEEAKKAELKAKEEAKKAELKAKEEAKKAELEAKYEFGKQMLILGDSTDKVKLITKLTDKQISKLLKEIKPKDKPE